jgi:hypothetical protein
MFRRVVLVLALATLMVMLMVGTVAPTLAQTFHPSTPGGPSVTPPPRIATPGQEDQLLRTHNRLALTFTGL